LPPPAASATASAAQASATTFDASMWKGDRLDCRFQLVDWLCQGHRQRLQHGPGYQNAVKFEQVISVARSKPG
jgi:hypothetical protein